MLARHRRVVLALCSIVVAVAPLPAQEAPAAAHPAKVVVAEDEAAFAKRTATLLLNVASFARGKKVHTIEKRAYDLVITIYDAEHQAARRALGYQKIKGEWQIPTVGERRQWVDKAKDKDRYDVAAKWAETARKLAELHRDRGLRLKDSAVGADVVAGDNHLRQAILFDPFDAAAHQALGHESDGGFFGTRPELDFIKSMKDLETFALTLAKKQYEVTPVEAIPAALQNTGFEFHGARTANFTVFTRGTQANADDVVQWGERALEFFARVCGEQHGRNARAMWRTWGWIGFLWTQKEREKFEEVNPDRSNATAFKSNNISWQDGGKTVEVSVALTPASMQDSMIAHVFKYGLLGMNEQLVEGAMHAATWYLKSTCITRYGKPPEGSVGQAELQLPEGANWWLREIRDQALAGTDVSMTNVPRMPFWRFSNDARLKSWNFMTWAMARFPSKWLQFVAKVDADNVPTLEAIAKAATAAFGQPLEQVEAEWRDWASGRGVTAAATGYGPPLLPERPNDEEIAGLTRLNAVRQLAQGLNFTNDARTPLPECDLDAEASVACKSHAVFLGMHEEHHQWPQAHEEDPAKDGFTPAGMRAGLRSVIVFGRGVDASASIDGWIGTVYHRFPLLEEPINRIGFAYAEGPAAEVIVLDMGSLEEPRNTDSDTRYSLVAWPPDGMRDVPRVFTFTEHPNPLEDVGLDFAAQQGTGYPVSLQLSRSLAQQITGASLELFEAKKRAGKFEKGDAVPCWVHTPDAPLLKRMEIRDVVFLIPKAHLAANTTYLAVARLEGVRSQPVEWTFTTGAQEQGLKLR